MEFNSEDIGWPEDTAFLTCDSPNEVMRATMLLLATHHIFVVNGKTGQIAMSRDAAREIGVL